MLQQTQVDRVVPKFIGFVGRFPDTPALASASLADVLREWKGLGYNGRAVRLHAVARAVVERHGGAIPNDRRSLLDLPGIGPYTAAAIRAFAFDIDDAPVDTNVRRIVHRLEFGIEHPPQASVRELDECALALMPPGRAHDWSSALMDLGSAVCTARAPRCEICPLAQQCAAAPIVAGVLEKARRASPSRIKPPMRFEATNRFARGRIVDRLRDLPPGQRISLLDLHACVAPVLSGRSIDDVASLVAALERDGLLATDGDAIALRD